MNLVDGTDSEPCPFYEEERLASSRYEYGKQWSVSLSVEGSSDIVTGVSVTGPGITGSLNLVYNSDEEEWNNWSSTYHMGPYWTEKPSPTPLTYYFTIVEPTTTTYKEASVDFIDYFAEPVLPSENDIINTSTPTINWNAPSSGTVNYYWIQVNEQNGPNVWYSEDIPYNQTTTIYNFDGRASALQPQKIYEWQIGLSNPNDDSSASRSVPFIYPGTSPVVGYISGQVKAWNNNILSGAIVRAYQGDVLKSTVVCDPSGYYTLTLSSGNYDIRASSSGYASQVNTNHAVAIFQTIYNVNFWLQAGAASYNVTGSIKDITNNAISGVGVTLSGTSTGYYVTSGDGYFGFSGLVPLGNYIITPVKSDYGFSPSYVEYNEIERDYNDANFIGEYNPVLGPQDIVINEIMYNPSGTDTNHEWIEIYNNKSGPINLTGWKFVDGSTHTFSSAQGDMIISAGGYAIITSSPANFLSDYSNNSSSTSWIIIKSAISLGNTNQYVALINTGSVVIDSLTYSNTWGGDGTDKTLERKNPLGSSVDQANWQESALVGGTPGASTSILPPSAPANVYALAVSSNAIRWDWDQSAGATYYNVYNSSGDILLASISDTTSWVEVGLSSNTQYSRYVKAGSSSGLSDKSSIISRFTLAYPPDTIAGMAVNSSTITLNWSYSGADKYEIWYSTISMDSDYVYFIATATVPNLNYMHTDLMAGGTYYYALAPVNGEDVPNYGYDFPNTVIRTKPGSGVVLSSAAVTTTGIDWQWNTVTGADGYRLFTIENGLIADVSGGITATYSETGLSTNTQTGRYLKAYNTAGESESSNHAYVYTLAAQPIGTDIVSRSSNSASILWFDNGNSAETMYEIYHSTDVSFNDMVTISTTGMTNINIGNLTADVTYYFKVRAYNGNNVVSAFDTVKSTFTSSNSPNGMPGLLTGNPLSETSVMWSWEDNATNESGYRVRDAETHTSLSGNLPLDTTYWLQNTGLTPNLNVSIYVEAYNQEGSLVTLPVSTYTLAAIPSGTKITVNSVSSNTISIEWTANSNSAGTKYGISRSLNGIDYSLLTTLYSLNYQDTGLASDTTYWYKVQAFNYAGVPTLFDVPASTITLPAPPAAPSGLYAVALTSESIRWEWNITQGATYYNVYNAADDTLLISLGGNDTTTWILASVSSNTLYSGYLRAGNIGGLSDKSMTVNRVTLAYPPNVLNADVFGTTRIDLTWNYSGASKYEILCSSIGAGLGWNTISTVTSPSISYSATGLEPGVTYYFKVAPINIEGAVSYAYDFPNASGRTYPTAVVSFSSSAVTATSITWAWAGAVGADGYNIYNIEDNSVIAAVPGYAASSFEETNLSTNIIYGRYIKPFNTTGLGDPSENVHVYTLAAVPAGSKITDGSVSSNTITVQWNTNTNPAGTVWGIEKSTDDFASSTVLKGFGDNYTSLSYIDQSVVPNTEYYYRILAYNGNGIATGFDTKVSTKTLLAPVSAPSNLTGVAVSTSSIMWVWEDTNSGASQEDGYSVKIAADNQLLANLPADTTHWIQTGLGVNSSTSVYVEAYNISGIAVSSAVIRYTLVNPPLDLFVADRSSHSIKIQWNANGNPAGTSWNVTGGSFSGGTSGTDLTITGLSADTSYTYTVQASNHDGVLNNNTLSVTTTTLKAPAAAPSGFIGSAIDNGSIMWVWNDTNAGSQQEDGYLVTRTSDNQILANLPADTTYWIQTGLGVNALSTVYIAAYNVSGQSTTNSLAVYTLSNVPNATAIINWSSATVTIQWNANGNPDGTRYGIIRSVDNFVSSVTVVGYASGIATTTYTDTGLNPDTTYYYRVQAFNGDALATLLDSAVFTRTLIAPPAAPELTGVSNSTTTVTWFWNPVASAVYYEIYNAADNVLITSATIVDYPTVAVQGILDTGLSANTPYSRYVVAVNTTGRSQKSADVTVYTLADAPASMTASSVSSSEIDLTWVDSGASKYKILFSTAGYDTEPIQVASTVDAPAVAYRHSGLESGTTYFYWINPVNMSGTETTGLGYPKASTMTLSVAFTVTTPVDPAVSTAAAINLPSGGTAEVDIPQNTFPVSVILTVSTTSVPATNIETIKVTGIGLNISAGGQQPTNDIIVTIYYQDSDVVGLDESKLTLGRYDDIRDRWIILPSVVDTVNNKIVARINHLSQFAVLQMVPASNLSGAKVYPNPYNPVKHPAGIIIDNLTANTEVRIYTISGVLVNKLIDSDGDGRIIWDGKNSSGKSLASGVYIAYVKGSNGSKKIKIAIEK